MKNDGVAVMKFRMRHGDVARLLHHRYTGPFHFKGLTSDYTLVMIGHKLFCFM